MSIWSSLDVEESVTGFSEYQTRRGAVAYPIGVDVALALSWTDDIRLSLFGDKLRRSDSTVFLSPDAARKVAEWLQRAAAQSEEHTKRLLEDD